ncbi:Ganglioside GM2 activator [Bulinus truncatus]|nr:Ganglioside GM2 activator [Bulinus truncatus]
MKLPTQSDIYFPFIVATVLFSSGVRSLSFKYNKVETFVINDDNTANGEDEYVNFGINNFENVLPSFPNQANDNKKSFLSLLTRQFSRHRISTSDLKKNSHLVMDDFKWKSCGPSDQLVDIQKLMIKPSPLYFPGNLSFGFDIIFHDTVDEDASVSVSVKLQFNKGSGSWITIPCIGQIGSCTYDDFCTLTKIIQCPQDLKQKGIPCTCPFNKGEYKIDNYNVEVDAEVFLSGIYQADVTITDSSKGQIACYVVNFTIG